MQALQGWACGHCKHGVHGTRGVPVLSLTVLVFTVVELVWYGVLLRAPTGVGWAEEKEVHKSLAAVKPFHCLIRLCVLTGVGGPEQKEPTSL